MADNVRLSAGTNDGATIRTLDTSSGVEYGVSVAAFATTVSPGANVVVEVTPTDRLPVAATLVGSLVIDDVTTPVVVHHDPAQPFAVESIADPVTVAQATASALKATVDVAPGQTLATVTTVGTITNPVAATQSGAWSVGLTGSPAVVASQATAANLLCTASQGGTWTVGVSGTPSVAQSGTWTVGLSGSPVVTAAQATAANLKATVDIAAGQTIAALTSITNPVAVTQSGAWSVGITGTPAVAQSGTWTVGLSASQTLATVTTVGAVTSITNPVGLASGANLIGKASVGQDASTLYSGTTALTPKYAKIAASASGDNAVVALASGKKIRVLRWGLTSNGTVAVKWRSNTTDLTGSRSLIQYASAGGAYSPVGIFETAVGEALNLNLSAAVAVGGELTYIEV